MWSVLDVECTGCGVYWMWSVLDVECTGCGVHWMWSILDVEYTPHPAFEDGTDRGFRNVGKPQSDAGEIPKRTYTIYLTNL